MSLLGYPLADHQQDLTPLQYTFLEIALPRVEARRNGQDPDEMEEEAQKDEPKPITEAIPQKEGEIFSLSQVTAAKRAEAKAKMKGE